MPPEAREDIRFTEARLVGSVSYPKCMLESEVGLSVRALLTANSFFFF